MNEGDRERAAGAYDKANLAYLRAHFVDRDSLAPLERIAYLALRSDGLVASRLFRELLREAPGDASLHVGLAYSEIATGNVEDARVALERAIEVDPDSTAAHAGLAIVLDSLQEYELARASNARAMNRGQDGRQVLNNLGISSLLAGRGEEAIAYLERASRLAPESALVANNLGLVFGLEGRDQAAMGAFLLHGSRGDALNNLGLVHYLRGDQSGARELFEEALLSNETNELRVLRNLERLDSVAVTK